jgi:hypothetical protein
VTYHLGSGPVASAVRVHRIGNVPSYRKLSPGPTLRKLDVWTRPSRHCCGAC